MFKAVIPARHASTRLPGKPLLDIAGKPMVVRVAEQALKSGADEVLVATDHPDIESVCKTHGLQVVMTRGDWPTGTDRIAEVAQIRGWTDDTVVVNVQGDEPLIDPALIDLVAKALLDDAQDIATCGHSIDNWEEFKNPNVVKIAMREDGEALYASVGCVACHAAGVAGAPKIGDAEAWGPRIEQGTDALYQRVFNGKGVMPPRGGSSASDEEIMAVVDYMVSQAQ